MQPGPDRNIPATVPFGVCDHLLGLADPVQPRLARDRASLASCVSPSATAQRGQPLKSVLLNLCNGWRTLSRQSPMCEGVRKMLNRILVLIVGLMVVLTLCSSAFAQTVRQSPIVGDQKPAP